MGGNSSQNRTGGGGGGGMIIPGSRSTGGGGAAGGSVGPGDAASANDIGNGGGGWGAKGGQRSSTRAGGNGGAAITSPTFANTITIEAGANQIYGSTTLSGTVTLDGFDYEGDMSGFQFGDPTATNVGDGNTLIVQYTTAATNLIIDWGDNSGLELNDTFVSPPFSTSNVISLAHTFS